MNNVLPAVLCVLLGIACACGLESSQVSVSKTDRIEVQYWEKWTGEEMEAMKRIVDKFNASQSEIHVKYLSVSGIADKTLLATSGGTPPDIAGLWGDQVVQFVDLNALTDLSDLANDAGVVEENYIPAYWSICSAYGRLYALPTSPGSGALYVNRQLVPPQYASPETFPKTISEFNKFAEQTDRRDSSGKLLVASFMPRDGWGLWNMPYVFGDGFLQDGQINVNGKDDLEAWTWVKSFTDRYGVTETKSFRSGFGNYSSPQNPFLSGKLATYADGPWFSNYIRMFKPSMDWFAVPFPYPDNHPELAGFSTMNLNTLVIPKGAKHAREAFRFLAFVQEQKNMEQLCMDQQCNSPLSNSSQKFLTSHPNKAIALFDKLAKSSRAVPPVPLGIRAQIGSEVGNAVDQMELGELTPQAALDQAQSRLVAMWAKYQQQVLGK